MIKKARSFTTAQFAALHHVNRRTLHYYDGIGLFSPKEKGENGYRYYDISQCVDFEYIRMLKELNMSLEEILEYLKDPNPERFIKIAAAKEKELDIEIQRLKHTKKILQVKREQITFCGSLQEQEIRTEECKAERILVLPYDFEEDDVAEIFDYLKDVWSIDQIRMGIGGYIALDKVYKRDFARYDGVYTTALTVLSNRSAPDSIIKPGGKYLCGYQKGSWDRLSGMYEKMLAYAEKNELKLTGYAYEMGLNEFAISDPDDYITKIMIKIEET